MENLELMFDASDEDAERELKIDLTKFNQAVIWGTDWTTETIARQLEKGNIDLNPSFQRRDAWSEQEKSRLIESLMLGFPVPPIILAENKNKKNSYIVIDGKQRLLSIRRFYSKVSDKEFKEKSLQEKNVFKQLKLKGLDILIDFNNKTYDQIETENTDYINNLDNQAIRTIVIKNWPDEAFLYTVFLRLNTGSKKLSPQELRQALKPGPFLDFLDEETASSETIKCMLNNKAADPRMKDIELALRYYAFKYFAKDYRGNLKEFLDYTCERLNAGWENNENEVRALFKELEESIDFIMQLFEGKSAFSRYTKGMCNDRFNRSIFEIFTYYFSLKNVRYAVEREKEKFKKLFINLNDDPEFVYAVSDTTKDINRVALRFNKLRDILLEMEELKEMKSSLPKFYIDDSKIQVIEAES
ncbi:DUF262 domain-containing protein [Lacrimispora sp.]|jgi:uncharacterized protein with ParB-like and HNH nuclease domain|uniref:DUF262 domain-containing protein n=1 Tax=Lacrimispora sp. TaxID=2719234 RepID=UPI0029E3E954|nr:hypothetical protein [Lacrimispora sp.]